MKHYMHVGVACSGSAYTVRSEPMTCNRNGEDIYFLQLQNGVPHVDCLLLTHIHVYQLHLGALFHSQRSALTAHVGSAASQLRPTVAKA